MKYAIVVRYFFLKNTELPVLLSTKYKILPVHLKDIILVKMSL